MPNIRDNCHCGGVLVPEKPLIGWPQSRASRWRDIMDEPMDAAARVHEHREPESTATPISHLSCNKCGLLYKAAEAGKTLEQLREAAYKLAGTYSDSPGAVTAKCYWCESAELAQEYAKGPYGIAPDRINHDIYDDPINHPIGIYCTHCNFVFGLLPPDTEKVKAHQAYIKELDDSIAKARAKAKE